MAKFNVFSHNSDKGTPGMRQTPVQGTDRDATRAARAMEVLGSQIDDILEERDGHLTQRTDLLSSRRRPSPRSGRQ